MAEPFPKLVRWGLLGPFAVFAAVWFLAVLAKDSPDSKVLNGIFLFATAGAAIVEIVAIPVAILLLVRDAPRYTSVGNIAMTLAAAVPILLVLLVVLALSGAFGTFHI